MKNILAAVDQSRHANAVVSRAAQLSLLLHTDLTILSVIAYDPTSFTTVSEERDRLAKFHKDLVYKHFPRDGISQESSSSDGTVYRHNPAGIKIHSMILSGNPADTICSCADQTGADLVIVGNRGLGSTGLVVLGSVSEMVVRKSSRSVLVVKGESINNSDREAVSGARKTSHQ